MPRLVVALSLHACDRDLCGAVLHCRPVLVSLARLRIHLLVCSVSPTLELNVSCALVMQGHDSFSKVLKSTILLIDMRKLGASGIDAGRSVGGHLASDAASAEAPADLIFDRCHDAFAILVAAAHTSG